MQRKGEKLGENSVQPSALDHEIFDVPERRGLNVDQLFPVWL
jgi:hypothetical protein